MSAPLARSADASRTVRSTTSRADVISRTSPEDSPAITAATSKSSPAAGGGVPRRLLLLVPQELDLAPEPALRVGVAQAPSRERGGPDVAAGDVEHDAAQRVVAGGGADTLFRGLRSGRFLRGVEPRAQEHARGAEHERRRESAPVGDAAGGDDRDLRPDCVDDFRHQRYDPARCAVAAALGALCNENVRAAGDGFLRERDGLDLADEARARPLDPVRKRLGVAEGKHDRGRLPLEREVEQLRLLRHAPRDEADAEARTGPPE